ncbi:MAG: hypothetical protein QMD71_01280 [bacterium]|nr:hypothetical protein [bacterium]
MNTFQILLGLYFAFISAYLSIVLSRLLRQNGRAIIESKKEIIGTIKEAIREIGNLIKTESQNTRELIEAEGRNARELIKELKNRL